MIGVRAALLTPTGPEKVALIPEGAVTWDKHGDIRTVSSWDARPAGLDGQWQDLRGYIVTPGFIDVHCHLPQYPAVGRGGYELLPWLRRYIFPLERQFTPSKAAREAPAFFDALKAHGITSAAVYTTVDAASTSVCFEAAEASGLQIVMGQMMMDRDSYAPGDHTDLTAKVVNESVKLCERWHGAADGRLQYAFSPRFAVTCTEELMRETADAARATGAFVQTHLSENREELAVVRELFPSRGDYTEVYEVAGLLGPRTILGHAIYLSERELRTLSATHSKIAHCPSSNLFLGSGVMDYQAVQSFGIDFGLGSDVAGGPELNPWQVMKAAAYSHQIRKCFQAESRVPSLAELFFAATAGSARVIGREDSLGRLAPGFRADLVAWDISRLLPYPEDRSAMVSAEDLLDRLVFRGALAKVRALWIGGVPASHFEPWFGDLELI